MVDARIVNWYSNTPTECLHLPSLEQLGATMGLMRHLDIKMFFTKLDISNMFYTSRPPLESTRGMRVQIGDTVYGFPFRWAHSPALAQVLLGMYLSVK